MFFGSENLVQALMAHGASAVCGYDAADRVIFWNERYVAFFPEVAPFLRVGTPYVETLEPFLALQHPQASLEERADAMRNAMHRHANEQGPIRYQRADGRWLELRMFPQPDGGRFKVWSDVSGQKAPGSDDSLLQGLMAVVNVGLIVHDAAGALCYVNSRFFSEHFLSLIESVPEIERRGAAQGEYWKKFQDIFGGDEAHALLCQSTQTGPLQVPLTMRARNGRFYRVQEQPWDAGGIACVWTDVTELIQREDALRAAHRELSLLNRKLIDLSETDALTGLPNRRRFNSAMQSAQAVVESGAQASLAIIDLDYFKSINDRFGHDVGDVALVEVARRLRALVPGQVPLARLGGEEFGLVFDTMPLTEAHACVEAVRQAFSAHPFVTGSEAIPLTVSIGIAPMLADRDASASLREADQALLRAKARGRDCVVLAGQHAAAGREHAWGDAHGAGAAAFSMDDFADELDLGATGLRDKYAPAPEHPAFALANWERAVRDGTTLDHYWGWVEYQISASLQAPDNE
ncbi:diguanylate cyclase [Variovorax sp. H27-G14]|uniref:sensor domain-containing diguanylate cyclase n=1 Tax=Variovorax sp. H27-G14 TaxID=3111914 RepID=UPI0038FC300E